MNRTFGIFRKDVRHLWPHIAVFLTLLVLAALFDPAYTSRDAVAYSLLGSLLPLACWSLVVAAIHEEKLTGDRQYWLTRPIGWRDLLAAKALFVVAFVNLPMLLLHIAIFSAVGVPLGEHFPALLWRQAFFTAFYILPVAALAATTRNIGQLIATAVAVALPVTLLQGFLQARFGRHWGDLAWMRTAAMAAILAAGVGAILAIQYSRRRTALARLAIVGVALAVLGVTFVPARRPSSSLPVRISLDSRRGRPVQFLPSSRDTVALEFPVRVDGIPEGVDLVKIRMTLALRKANRPSWGGMSAAGGLHEIVKGEAWLGALVDKSMYEFQRDTPIDMSGSVDFALFTQSETFPVPRDRDSVVPGIGACSPSVDSVGGISIVCRTPFPRMSLYLGKPGRGVNWIVPGGFVGPPLSTAAEFQPLTKFTSQLPFSDWKDIGDAQLITGRPLAQLNVPFSFEDIKLRDFAAR